MDDVLKDGLLEKEGGSSKSWHQRQFVLRPRELLYYKNREFQGRLLLTDVASVERHPGRNGRQYCFAIIARDGRDYVIAAANENQRREWIDAIQNALDNLNGGFRQRAASAPRNASNKSTSDDWDRDGSMPQSLAPSPPPQGSSRFGGPDGRQPQPLKSQRSAPNLLRPLQPPQSSYPSEPMRAASPPPYLPTSRSAPDRSMFEASIASSRQAYPKSNAGSETSSVRSAPYTAPMPSRPIGNVPSSKSSSNGSKPPSTTSSSPSSSSISTRYYDSPPSSPSPSSEGIVYALYDYLPKQSDELQLRVGDEIAIIDVQGEWYRGDLNGRIGWFPRTYVSQSPPGYNDNMSTSSRGGGGGGSSGRSRAPAEPTPSRNARPPPAAEPAYNNNNNSSSTPAMNTSRGRTNVPATDTYSVYEDSVPAFKLDPTATVKLVSRSPPAGNTGAAGASAGTVAYARSEPRSQIRNVAVVRYEKRKDTMTKESFYLFVIEINNYLVFRRVSEFRQLWVRLREQSIQPPPEPPIVKETVLTNYRTLVNDLNNWLTFIASDYRWYQAPSMMEFLKETTKDIAYRKTSDGPVDIGVPTGRGGNQYR